MKPPIRTIWIVFLAVASPLMAGERLLDHYPQAKQSGCMKCHEGIELIREPGSEMLERIMELGEQTGDPAGCIVCHGGDPTATEKEAAHAADRLSTPIPAAPGSTRRPAASAIPTMSTCSGTA